MQCYEIKSFMALEQDIDFVMWVCYVVVDRDVTKFQTTFSRNQEHVMIKT